MSAFREAWLESEGANPWRPSHYWHVPRAAWWQRVLETDWATTAQVDAACGPMYRMYVEQLP